MPAAGIVIVREQYYVRSAQEFVVLREPFLGSASAGRRRKAKGSKIVAVFLALGDMDLGAIGDRVDQFREPVQNAADIGAA